MIEMHLCSSSIVWLTNSSGIQSTQEFGCLRYYNFWTDPAVPGLTDNTDALFSSTELQITNYDSLVNNYSSMGRVLTSFEIFFQLFFINGMYRVSHPSSSVFLDMPVHWLNRWGVVRSLSVGELGRVGLSSQHKQLTSTWQFTGPHSSDQQRTGNSVNQWRPTCCKTTAVSTPTWPLKSVTHSAATHF